MAHYRLKPDASDSALSEAPWLKGGNTYRGFVHLAFTDDRKVRLFHPEGGGSVDVDYDYVEVC